LLSTSAAFLNILEVEGKVPGLLMLLPLPHIERPPPSTPQPPTCYLSGTRMGRAFGKKKRSDDCNTESEKELVSVRGNGHVYLRDDLLNTSVCSFKNEISECEIQMPGK
jgi:hypothetical protein